MMRDSKILFIFVPVSTTSNEDKHTSTWKQQEMREIGASITSTAGGLGMSWLCWGVRIGKWQELWMSALKHWRSGKRFTLSS